MLIMLMVATPTIAAGQLQSGVYEGLQLAVGGDGAITGTFTRETDTEPTRTCDFNFTGYIKSDGSADIAVRSSPDDPVLKGLLVKTRDGVALHVPGLAVLPACDQLPETPPGSVPFGHIGPPNGGWLATISSARARLFLSSKGAAWHGYLVKDDYVALGQRQGGRWEAVFLSPSGRRSHGWLDAGDVVPFPRR